MKQKFHHVLIKDKKLHRDLQRLSRRRDERMYRIVEELLRPAISREMEKEGMGQSA